MKTPLAIAVSLCSFALASAADPLARLEPVSATPFRVSGKGVINDATLRIAFDPSVGEASIEIESGEGDDKGQEIAAGSLADVSAAAVAAVHPALVASAMRENRQNLRSERNGTYVFAGNDALWTVATDAKANRILSLKRRDFGEVHGDGDEEVVFASSPAGDARRDRGHAVHASDAELKELAPHLFTIDLPALNSRVTVAEFADHAVVIEGAYNARIGDVLARAIREKLGKPIRYHAFSHLHGQYVGSTRSFVAEGAAIIVPKTTVPRAAKIETVKTSRRLEDAENALEIFNVVSEHTDEYFVFWFPGPKILLTGDLLFFRPGKPLAGRSTGPGLRTSSAAEPCARRARACPSSRRDWGRPFRHRS